MSYGESHNEMALWHKEMVLWHKEMALWRARYSALKMEFLLFKSSSRAAQYSGWLSIYKEALKVHKAVKPKRPDNL